MFYLLTSWCVMCRAAPRGFYRKAVWRRCTSLAAVQVLRLWRLFVFCSTPSPILTLEQLKTIPTSAASLWAWSTFVIRFWRRRNSLEQARWHHDLNALSDSSLLTLQCFDAVGWATGGASILAFERCVTDQISRGGSMLGQGGTCPQIHLLPSPQIQRLTGKCRPTVYGVRICFDFGERTKCTRWWSDGLLHPRILWLESPLPIFYCFGLRSEWHRSQNDVEVVRRLLLLQFHRVTWRQIMSTLRSKVCTLALVGNGLL